MAAELQATIAPLACWAKRAQILPKVLKKSPMSLGDEAKPGPPEGRDPVWIVWLLLAAAASFAVFSAVRAGGSSDGEPSQREAQKKAKPARKEVKPAGEEPSKAPRVVEQPLVTARSLVEQHCPGKPADDCACLATATARALTLGAPDTALELGTNASAACAGSPQMTGFRAEALVRSGKADAALALLPEITALDPRNSSVPYVRAIAALKQGDSPQAAREAGSALDLGRGAPALVALALAAFQDGELDKASTSLERALKLSPDDVDALYNLAVIDQRRNRYTPARSGYLRVLRVRPDHADARSNLVVLALGVGAVAEARHHQRELEKIVAADDLRALKLAEALGKAEGDAAPVVLRPPR